jgi:hypothetical protein
MSINRAGCSGIFLVTETIFTRLIFPLGILLTPTTSCFLSYLDKAWTGLHGKPYCTIRRNESHTSIDEAFLEGSVGDLLLSVCWSKRYHCIAVLFLLSVCYVIWMLAIS